MQLVVNYLLFAVSSSVPAFIVRRDGKPYIIAIVLISICAGLFSVSISWSGSSFFDRRIYSIWYGENFPLYLIYPELISGSSQQPGWIVFNLICLFFSKEPAFLFFAVAFLYTFSALLLFRAYDLGFFSAVMLYLAFPAVVYSAAWCRQMVAAALFSIALIEVHRRRPLLSVILTLLAASVHITQIVMLPILVVGYFFDRPDSTNQRLIKATIAVLIFAAIAGPTIIRILKNIPILQKYISLGSFEGDPGSIITVFKGLPYLLSLIMMWLNMETSTNWSQNNTALHLLVLAFGCTAWLSVLSVYWMVRLPVYTVPSTIILLSNQTGNKQRYNKLFIICIYIISSLITLREVAVLFS